MTDERLAGLNVGTTDAAADEGGFRASRCPPDDLFGVTYPSLVDGAVRAAMLLEEWDFDEGLLVTGALGVLVDNVLGYANITRAPGRWGITTAMTLDRFPTACAPGEQLLAEARVVRANGLGALSEGRVLSPTGALVATCSQRTRFVDTLPDSVRRLGSAAAAHRPDLLASALRTDGADVHVEVRPELQNPLGALHGGVSMYVCERAATEALRALDAPLGIVSLHMSYLRLLRGAEQVRFRPEVIHRGRTLAIVDVVGSLDDGRPAVVARAAAEPAS